MIAEINWEKKSKVSQTMNRDIGHFKTDSYINPVELKQKVVDFSKLLQLYRSCTTSDVRTVATWMLLYCPSHLNSRAISVYKSGIIIIRVSRMHLFIVIAHAPVYSHHACTFI